MKKILLLFVAMTSIVCSRAESGWTMVTDSGVKVPMEQVGMLVSADDATTFSVVRTEGSGETINGVVSVSFTYEAGASAIENIGGAEVGMMHDAVNSSLLVMGCGGHAYAVYDMSGALKLGGSIESASARIDVSNLGSGVYVLRVGNSSLKFLKK